MHRFKVKAAGAISLSLKRAIQTAARKFRQFTRTAACRGLWGALYWSAFALLKPNRFVVYRLELSDFSPAFEKSAGIELAIWRAETLEARRAATESISPEFFQNRIDGAKDCAVALENETIAGLIWLYRASDPSRFFALAESELELNYGVVNPRYRNRGIFRAVIAHACDHARSCGYTAAYAAVHAGNQPSMRAFKAVGFREVGRLRHFFCYRPKFHNIPSSILDNAIVAKEGSRHGKQLAQDKI